VLEHVEDVHQVVLGEGRWPDTITGFSSFE
jgi:hypothetical protein